MTTLDCYLNHLHTLDIYHISNRLLVVVIYVDKIPIVRTQAETIFNYKSSAMFYFLGMQNTQ